MEGGHGSHQCGYGVWMEEVCVVSVVDENEY